MNIKGIGLTLALCTLCIMLMGQSQQRKRYIQRFQKIAVSEMERSGIPASIKLAQAILESADGTSTLAQKANNHFGIKCGGSWKGRTYYKKDDDRDRFGRLKKSCFRAYKNSETSFVAHTDFLADPKKKHRYGFLFDYKPTEYKKWAKGLRKAGYATNKKYPQLLIKIIEDNKLFQFDKMSSNDLDDKFVSNDRLNNNDTKRKEELKYNRVFSHNDVKMVFAKKGDTPLKIAKRFNKSVRRIMKYNEISANTIFEDQERVYIQPKRSKFRGKQQTHKVQKGETMHDIAQLYGIKLKKLYKKNKMPEGREPAVGALIALRKKAKSTPRLVSKNSTQPKTNKDKSNPSKKSNKTKSTTTSKPNQTVTHVVQKGETLYRISKKYNVSVDRLKKLNKLESNSISIGQKLIIKL